MKLHRVIDGKHLHFPPQIAEGIDSLWLRNGGIVDLADPFVAKCVEGQEYKLEFDSEATAPTPITNQRFHRLRESYLNAGKEQPSSQEASPEPEGANAIPRPDSRPTAGKEKRHGAASSGQVPPSDPR